MAKAPAALMGAAIMATMLSTGGQAAPLTTIHSDLKAAGQQSALHRVHQSCRRCRDCRPVAAAPRYYSSRVYYAVPPPVYYAVPRYEPSVIYYGPAGAYRPYPPVVVYDVPPRYSYSRWDDDDFRYHRRW
jgi:hypothetical protein